MLVDNYASVGHCKYCVENNRVLNSMLYKILVVLIFIYFLLYLSQSTGDASIVQESGNSWSNKVVICVPIYVFELYMVCACMHV